jgi:hypothetical protein
VAPRVSAGADRRDHSAARGARAAEGDAGDRLAHQRFARSECTECGRVPTGAERDGYVEGKNVAIEYRWAEGSYDRLPALASDLVGRKVDVIVTGGPALLAAKDATSTIPILVFYGFSTPIKIGSSTEKPCLSRRILLYPVIVGDAWKRASLLELS